VSLDKPKPTTEPQAAIRRPAVYFVIPFAAGLTLSVFTSIPILLVLISSAVFFVIAVYLFVVKNGYSRWAVYLSAFAAGLFLHSVISQTVPTSDISLLLDGYRPINTEVTGVIANDPEYRGDSTLFNLSLEKITQDEAEDVVAGKSRVTIYDKVPLNYGDRVRLSGELSRPTPPRFPAGFDYGKYLRARGTNSILKVSDGSDISVIGRGRVNPIYWFSFKAKGFIADSIDKCIGGRAAGFVKGLLLGARGEIESEIRDDFAAAGVAHILAVSGQHVSLLALIIFLALGTVRVPRRYAAAIVMIFLPLFAILTGMKPPVIRAAIMAEMVLLAIFIERDIDLFNSLAAAAIFILAFNPLLINDISFVLSYSACIGIALGYRPAVDWFTRYRFPPFLRETMAATFAAQLGVLPLQLWYFHRLTPVSLFSNLAIVPASALTMVFGLLTVVTDIVFPPLAKLYGAAAYAISEIVFYVTGLLANGLAFLEPTLSGFPPYILHNLDLQFWIGRPSIIILILIWMIPVILFVKNDKIRKIAVFASLGLIFVNVWAAALSPKEPELELIFLPVGNADSCVIITPDKKAILVDTGNSFGDYSAGRSMIEPFLHSRGIDHIDIACITHSDGDHIGGADYLVRELPVGELWLRANDDRKLNSELRLLAEECGTEIIEISPGSRTIDGVLFERLWPSNDADLSDYSENDRSTVLSVRYGDFRALLTGDVERILQRKMISDGMPLTADLLKAPHHGKSEDLSAEFAKEVLPYFTAITCKYAANGASPDTETVEAFEALGCKVADTGRYGAITVTTNGEIVKLTTAY